MDVNVIASGSKGNAVLLDGRILIDCGITYKKLEQYVPDLELVLLTHQHQDHFKKSCIHRLAKERPGLRYACGNWMAPLLIMEKVSPRKIDIIPENAWMNYSGIGVKVKQQHTSHDVPNCCWHIDINGEKAIYATDLGTMEGITAKDYDLYLIEANRSRAELDKIIEEKRKRDEYSYEYRVIGTHLFEEQAREFIANNAGEHSQYIFLHQHRET